MLDLPKNGCINFHAGLLPKYRGLFPIFYAITNDEKKFGVTVHYMDEKFDNGPIIFQEEVLIGEKENILDLYPKAFRYAGELLVKSIDSIESNSVVTIYNDSTQKNYNSYPDQKTIKKYKQKIKKN